jgi:ribosome maturation factor RimP
VYILNDLRRIARGKRAIFFGGMKLTEIRTDFVLECLEGILVTRNIFLVDFQVQNAKGSKRLQIFVDTDSGITISQCAEVSRDLRERLAGHNVDAGDFEIEISSPGIDRPLKLLRQYSKNIGRELQVTFLNGDLRKSFEGILEKVDDRQLIFLDKSGTHVPIDFSHIIESKEKLPW